MFQPIVDEIERTLGELAALLAAPPEPWTWWQRTVFAVAVAIIAVMMLGIVAFGLGCLWQINRAVWGF